jgi:NADH-quinone oxidoreductase subunit L
MSNELIVGILLLSPIIGFLFNGIRFKSHEAYVAGTVATLAAFVSFVCSLVIFSRLLHLPHEQRQILVNYYTWTEIGAAKINVSFMFDQISIMMAMIVTGVGTLIHLFSVGYMSHDERPSKYFAYLNLFLFNMLLLILGSNLIVMFVGWEGVGLCSYLLIGFWFKDAEKATAGMKAFITNRIGDAGLLLGIFVLFSLFGTFEFQEINARMLDVAGIPLSLITASCLLLFVGAAGKSAQIPLYVWLPDAMAGPTPVSALIHAATMVTAGIYMIVRLNPLFLGSPTAMTVVAVIGATTAVFAASIGLAQWDIKKILAYSTVSQLGYMFLACGVGAYGAAMFHLMTHAFFKALMFLGSGSVIHAMDGEQDVRKMGGLKKYLPITHITFFVGWLAIIGTPMFAGFFSKDEILWMAWHSPRGHFLYWFAGVIGAGMTAFYMTRLMALTFWGKSRVPKEIHPHESPPSMTIPLIILAVLSLVGGYIGIPHVLGHAFHIPNILETWFEGKILPIPGMTEATAVEEILLMIISVLVAAASATLAYIFYIKDPSKPKLVVSKIPKLHNAVYNKYFVDEFYQEYILNPTVKLSRALWLYMDVEFIDKATYKLTDFVQDSAEGLKSLQTGNLQRYALYIVVGFIAMISVILF